MGVLTRCGVLLGMAFLFCFGATPGFAADVITPSKVDGITINWTKRQVLFAGQGSSTKAGSIYQKREESLRKAEADALQTAEVNLPALHKHYPFSLPRDSQVNPKVCRPVSTEYFANGEVKILMGCSLDALLGPSAVEGTSTGVQGGAQSGTFVGPTSVIVVAPDIEPSLFPSLQNRNGENLFVWEDVKNTVALRRQGSAVFVNSLRSAKRRPRAGARPMVLYAKAKGDAVVFDSDASKTLRKHGQGLLQRGRLLIVLQAP